jgi:hypothetical protein
VAALTTGTLGMKVKECKGYNHVGMGFIMCDATKFTCRKYSQWKKQRLKYNRDIGPEFYIFIKQMYLLLLSLSLLPERRIAFSSKVKFAQQIFLT